ncbi:MAG: hypothetical protein FH753_07010 [Firmicutes bacterium]|nr:hypothetical protein [Bacillota bacterium]
MNRIYVRRLIPNILILILIVIGALMVFEKINMEPELLFEDNYFWHLKNGSLFSYDGDSTFLYITYANLRYVEYINFLCIIGILLSFLNLIINKNKSPVLMFIVYFIFFIYTIVPYIALSVFNIASPLISYEAAFLTFQFNYNELLVVTLSYIIIILLFLIYLYKHIKKYEYYLSKV